MKSIRTSGYAPVNGLKMYYEIHGGNGLPLVLIHGGGSTIGSSFGKLIPLLAPQFKLLAVELQAHGRTSDREGPESFIQDADDVAALLKFLKIDKANFLGFSNGGTTALQIAIRHPDLVNKIVVVSANYKKEGMVPGFFEGFQNATLDDMPFALKAAFLEVTPDQSRLRVMFEKDVERMVQFTDMDDAALKSIKVPALLAVGDRDVVTTAHVLKMSQLIQESRLVVLPGTHGSFIGEATEMNEGKLPAVFATLVQEFLSG
jgi:pimeloyl-ACP methyl ester carboxylesterase